MTTKHLGELNSTRFWCPCQMHVRGECPNYVVAEMSKPGSRARHYGWLILALIACVIAELIFTLGSR